MLCTNNAYESDSKSIQIPETTLLSIDSLRNSIRETNQIREGIKDHFDSEVGSVLLWQVKCSKRKNPYIICKHYK